MQNLLDLLRQFDVQPTPQRLAVAQYVLYTDSHPTAEEVFSKVQPHCPTLSKATVYNSLNLFVEKGLLRTQTLRGGAVVFDSNTRPHHHFIDVGSGRIFDIAPESVLIQPNESLAGFEITEYQVTLRGRLRKPSH